MTVETMSVLKKQYPMAFMTKMVWVAIVMLVVSSMAFKAFSSNYMIVVDGNADPTERCIPEFRYYFLERKVEAYQMGGIYTFVSQGMTPVFNDGTLITKYLVGKAGDLVVQNEQGVFINGNQVSAGYPLAGKLEVNANHYHKEYTIPEGHYFFTAPSDISFDSRYWGLVKNEQIVGKANPLW